MLVLVWLMPDKNLLSKRRAGTLTASTRPVARTATRLHRADSRAAVAMKAETVSAAGGGPQ